MADRTSRFSLLSRFEKLCKENGYPKPIINKNIEQWSADALIESFGLQMCYDTLDYYFKVSRRPAWKSFSYAAGDLIKAKQDLEADLAFRLEMRERARKWLSE